MLAACLAAIPLGFRPVFARWGPCDARRVLGSRGQALWARFAPVLSHPSYVCQFLSKQGWLSRIVAFLGPSALVSWASLPKGLMPKGGEGALSPATCMVFAVTAVTTGYIPCAVTDLPGNCS